VCGGYPTSVEVARDLTEGPAGLTLRSDVVDEFRREDARPSWFRLVCPPSSWPPPFGEQSRELVDRDEPGSPRHLDRLDEWQDAPVEGGSADAEGLGRLRARIREPLDTCRLSNDLDGRCCSFGRRRRVSLSLLTPVP